MRSIPGMRVVVPCDGPETKDAVLSAYKEKGPFYIRIGRSKIATIEKKKKFTLGKGYVVEEECNPGDVAGAEKQILAEVVDDGSAGVLVHSDAWTV